MYLKGTEDFFLKKPLVALFVFLSFFISQAPSSILSVSNSDFSVLSMTLQSSTCKMVTGIFKPLGV
jgi:hypothetical protein